MLPATKNVWQPVQRTFISNNYTCCFATVQQTKADCYETKPQAMCALLNQPKTIKPQISKTLFDSTFQLSRKPPFY